MNNFYTYVYHDGPTPIYVGKGKGKRAHSHLKKSHNPFLKNKLAKMKREGREPRIQIIDAPGEAAAFEMETLLIAMIGRHDLGTGPLLNLTDGGEGLAGQVISEESRARMSVAQKARCARPEVMAKLRETAKASWIDPNTRAARSIGISKVKTGKPRDEETKQTISKTKKENGPSEAWIKCFCKPCTVDGITIYPSKTALTRALGAGLKGARHPNFRYVHDQA